jgi:hypothetical protein
LRSGLSGLEERGMMARIDEKEKFVFPFEKLEVWQLAIELADFVVALLESLPLHRHTRLIGQMEAAVCSIAQNIAEGKEDNIRRNSFSFFI